ncbi:hypothetical protein [Rhodococcus sp. WB9]|uniref:hypothetical protein n=1 Tax=Rhodococcus sp. WB9 TaxID=2594007 RepID=UPI0021B1E6C1|nr:hypothetical protein [Rhodococcus sp. WB9]
MDLGIVNLAVTTDDDPAALDVRWSAGAVTAVAAVLDPVSVVTDVLPGTAAGSLAGSRRDFGGDTTPGVLNILDDGTSVLLLAGYVAAFTLGTVWLVRRRDVN